MRLFLFITLVFLIHGTKAQILSLDDIIKVRLMDSVQLISFAHRKGFELKEVEFDNYRSVHKYYSTTNNGIRFERNFPTGKNFFAHDTTKRDNRMVYYHFSDGETLKEFRKEMKSKGFKFKKTNTMYYGRDRTIHNIYVTKENEIDLTSGKFVGQ